MNEYLSIKWTVSRARDTYGYNVCTLTDTRGSRFRCNGGGYDMIGTVVGDWLHAFEQSALMAIKDKAGSVYDLATHSSERVEPGLYGLTLFTYNGEPSYLRIDGACGIETVRKIAKAAGIELKANYQKSGRGRGNTLGFMVSPVETAGE